MSYSRRQLEALGEPIGESATRLKEGGFGRIYGGGGGGGGGSPSPVQQQTTISDLPDWAKGYAQDVLAKGKALTEGTPYQAYGGQRVADLSPLQKTAMGTVASPEAFGKSVQGYMSPYMQNVVEAQQRAAREQGGVNAATLQARGAQAGAFGGSGMALTGAQQARDLTKQISDIQAMGSQQAFQQGVQQANTAIGQQTQLGALQQQQAQRPLDIAYQDFLNQKNYPYQQLSYMSNLVRGTPMGMNSQSQVYQSPGSLTGQLAGLGVGALGLTSMYKAATGAEGGQVHAYADGGSVESQSNVGDIVKGLSDQQLAQAEQAALARGDYEQLQAILSEKAIRASERRGLASAYNQMPYSQQEAMAGGGIVAFSGASGDQQVKNEEATSEFGDMLRSIGKWFGDVGNPETNPRARESQIRDQMYREKPGFFESLTPSERAAREAKVADLNRQIQVKQAETQSTPADSPFAATSTKLLQEGDAADLADQMGATQKTQATQTQKGKATPSIGDHPVAQQVIRTAKAMGVPQEDTESLIGRLMDKMSTTNKADNEEANKLMEAQKGRADEIRKGALGQALAQFGFNWAQQAAQPGGRFLGSAAKASPVIAQVAFESQKLAQAAEDNYANMRLNELRYQQSVRKGDMQTALQYANLINQDKKSQQLIEIERQKLGIMAQHYAQAGGSPVGKVVNELAQRDPEFASLPGQKQFEIASRIAGYGFRTDAANAGKLQAALSAIEKRYSMLPILEAGGENDMTRAMRTKMNEEVNRAYQILGDGQTAPGAAGTGVTIPKGVTIEKIGG